MEIAFTLGERVGGGGGAVSILRKQSQTDDKELFSNMGVQQGITTPCHRNSVEILYTSQT
jgi:hypothetical protein